MRTKYLATVLICIPLGLATRKFPALFPELISTYGGDTLWAVTLYFCIAFVFPTDSSAKHAAWTVAISFLVELSQLYTAPWINDIRATTVGALLLGRGFLWSDLACYVVGAKLAVVVDCVLRATWRFRY